MVSLNCFVERAKRPVKLSAIPSPTGRTAIEAVKVQRRGLPTRLGVDPHLFQLRQSLDFLYPLQADGRMPHPAAAEQRVVGGFGI